MPNNSSQKPVRIWNVIQLERLLSEIGYIPKDFSSLTIYEYLGDGVIKLNIGIKKRQNSILFYDITHVSEEFKKKFGKYSIEIDVREVQKVQEPNPCTELGDKIITVMRLTQTFSTSIMDLTGSYADLNKEELTSLGRDFVCLKSTPEGIKLSPAIRISEGYFKDLYLRIDPSLLDATLLAKISGELTELICKPNGLYMPAKDEDLKTFINTPIQN